MYNLKINKGSGSPEILMCKKQGLFQFKGNCIPENPKEIFAPILGHLKSYVESPQPITTLQFQLKHINSVSLYFLYRIIESVKPIKDSTRIFWLHNNSPWLIETIEILRHVTEMDIISVESLDKLHPVK